MWVWIVVLFLSFFIGLSIGYALKIAFKIFLLLLAFTIIFNAFLWYIGILVFTTNIKLDVFIAIWNTIKSANVSGALELSLELIVPIVGFILGVAYAIKRL